MRNNLKCFLQSKGMRKSALAKLLPRYLDILSISMASL